MPIQSASQTIGPYWHLLEEPEWADLTRWGAQGERMELIGHVSDGDGVPVTDGCIEIWQADPPASDEFPAWGRAATDVDGNYRLVTLKPGPVPGNGNTQQAPHIAIAILARGLLKPLFTRAYFAGEALNEDDPVLGLVENPARRARLIARREGENIWRLDIRLQGEGESVFFEV
jgi:protocatechuate 3,4-dioxygenase, alpha subunit